MIDRPVREMMDSSVPTEMPDTTIKDVVHLFAKDGLDGIAVVDAQNIVVGIVTAGDLLYQEVEAEQEGSYAIPFLDWIIHTLSLEQWERQVEKAFAVTVSDTMTKTVHTASPDETLHVAAMRMAKESVSRLPVVEEGVYLGMITRGHVVSALDRFEFGGEVE